MDVEAEAEAGAWGRAGAVARNLRLFLSSSWTYSTSGRGIVGRAGADTEPLVKTEWPRFGTRAFDALGRSTSAFPVAASGAEPMVSF